MATINFLAEGRVLIPNKSTPVGTIGSGDEPAIKFLQIASVVAKQTYHAGLLAHYFVFGEAPMISQGEPMIAEFGEADNAVILAYKQVGTSSAVVGKLVQLAGDAV